VPESQLHRPTIAACVLLAGGPRPSPLLEQTRIQTLELWLTARQTVFNRWCDTLYDSTVRAESLVEERPEVLVVHSGGLTTPRSPFADPRFRVHTLQDPGALRGPAGALRDVTERFGPDDLILVTEAARYIAGSLDQFFADWSRHRPDVLIACHPDGTPTGVMLVRRGTLELVQPKGFIDLKEQWLDKVLKTGLRVWTSETRDFQPYLLRTREQFLAASAVASGRGVPSVESASVLGPPRTLRAGMDKSRVADSAHVAAGAVIADAIVMPGARIGAEAVVVRSIVCPGGEVPAGSEAIDTVITAA
jgi:hypothetical protein